MDCKKEFPNFPPGCKYYFQENACIDERAIIEWVRNILKPYIEMATKNVVLMLVLDSYQCRMMALAVKPIKWLGIEVDLIPGGCTSLYQPVDVGINKALKSLVPKDWGDWMMDSGIIVTVVIPPTWPLIVEWVIKARDSISVDIMPHSWRHGVCSLFH